MTAKASATTDQASRTALKPSHDSRLMIALIRLARRGLARSIGRSFSKTVAICCAVIATSLPIRALRPEQSRLERLGLEP